MVKVWRAFLDSWEDFRSEPEEYRQLDADRVLVYVRDRGRGKASGMEISQIMGTEQGASLFVIRDVKVVKLVNYWSREKALADLGLTPDGKAADSP
ncbi:MAG TPA: hypothetical protein VII01_00095 [Solirubrobacteraceae bacterium]